MRSDTTGAGSDWAGRAGLRADTRAHRARVGLLYVGDRFQHDLGYVRRRGVATLFGRYARVFRPADTAAAVREYSLGAEVDVTADDRLRTGLTRMGRALFTVLFADSGELRASATSTVERLERPFPIGNGRLEVAPGEYSFDEASLEYSSNRSAALSGSVEVTAGEFWTGRQRRVTGSTRWRFDAHLAATVTLSRNEITLPAGRFDATLVGLRLDWSLTPRMFLNAFVQRNTETDTWLSNVRFNLIHRPLSDIYVVWNETRMPGTAGRAVMLKYTHLVAF